MKTEGIALGEADLGNEEKRGGNELRSEKLRTKDKRQREKKIEKKGQGPREKKTIPP